MNLANDRDSRVLADVAALAGTVSDPKMTPHDRPRPPVPPMAPIGPRHVSGTGRPGDPFVFADPEPTPQGPYAPSDVGAPLQSPERIAAIKARRARMLATVAGARWPGDRPEEGEDR
jgi:hypothetical protein